MKLFESLLSFTMAIRDDSFDDLDERAKLFVENTVYKEASAVAHARLKRRESNFSAKAALQKPNWNHEINSESKVSMLSWLVSQLSYAEDSLQSLHAYCDLNYLLPCKLQFLTLPVSQENSTLENFDEALIFPRKFDRLNLLKRQIFLRIYGRLSEILTPTLHV